MAKKRHTKKRTTKRRRTIGALSVAPRRKAKGAGKMSWMDALKHVGAGVAGAIVVTKFGDMVPIKNTFYRNLAIVGGSLFLMRKPGLVRSFGIGTGVASGVLAVAEKAPKLLMANTTGSGMQTKTVGRMSTASMEQMEAAARMRARLNGLSTGRDNVMMGTGNGDYRPITGRDSVIMGSGGIL